MARRSGRKSKRFRPVLPSVDELETANPLYKIGAKQQEDEEEKRVTLPKYYLRQMSMKTVRKPKKRTGAFQADVDGLGFTSTEIEKKKDYNNFYFSPFGLCELFAIFSCLNLVL